MDPPSLSIKIHGSDKNHCPVPGQWDVNQYWCPYLYPAHGIRFSSINFSKWMGKHTLSGSVSTGAGGVSVSTGAVVSWQAPPDAHTPPVSVYPPDSCEGFKPPLLLISMTAANRDDDNPACPASALVLLHLCLSFLSSSDSVTHHANTAAVPSGSSSHASAAEAASCISRSISRSCGSLPLTTFFPFQLWFPARWVHSA